MPSAKQPSNPEPDNILVELAAAAMPIPTFLVDWQIEELCKGDKPMITNFIDHSVREVKGNGVVSYGLSTVGYDVRLSRNFKFPSPSAILDVHGNRLGQFTDEMAMHEPFVLRPGAFALGCTVEGFNIPDNVVGLAYPKSTWLRSGIHVPISPLEPGWSADTLVVEIINNSTTGVVIYPGEGIAQIMFYRLADTPRQNYGQRGGRYNGQRGVQVAK